MGAWDKGIFDNDNACDWAHDFVMSGDMSVIDSTLSSVVRTGHEGVHASDACEALVACEVLARLLGRWGERSVYSGGIDEWVESHPQKPSESRLELAREAIDRILGENSELRELWSENPGWLAVVNDLRSRL